DPRRLSRLFRGELDWVVMKCLEKDRNRRYETANGLARDLQRYLHDEPVQACPPSAWYQLRKFARRNKAGLASAASPLVSVSLLAGGIGWIVRDREAQRVELSQQAMESLRRARAWFDEDKLPLARQELAEAKGRIGSDRAAHRDLFEEIVALEAEMAR